MKINRVVLSLCLVLGLVTLTGCGNVVEDLEQVGTGVLEDGYYDGYYDYSINESESRVTLSFYSVSEMPYWQDDFDAFMDIAFLEVQTMVEDYYRGSYDDVIYIEQIYDNGYCSTRINLGSGAYNIVCQMD